VAKKSRSLKKKKTKKDPQTGKEKNESASPKKDVKTRENVRMDVEE